MKLTPGLSPRRLVPSAKTLKALIIAMGSLMLAAAQSPLATDPTDVAIQHILFYVNVAWFLALVYISSDGFYVLKYFLWARYRDEYAKHWGKRFYAWWTRTFDSPLVGQSALSLQPFASWWTVVFHVLSLALIVFVGLFLHPFPHGPFVWMSAFTLGHFLALLSFRLADPTFFEG